MLISQYACSLEGKLWHTEGIKEQRHRLADKGPSCQSYDFSSSHVQMWELDHKEGWTLKNWCFQTVVLKETLESPLDCKRDQTSQSWRKSTPRIHWKDWCWRWNSNTLATWCKEPTHWKRPWCWERLKAEENGVAEDEIVGWHQWLNGHEFEQTLGDGEGLGSLACCSPWSPRVGTTEQLNNSNVKIIARKTASQVWGTAPER